jgi:hypothetical protein
MTPDELWEQADDAEILEAEAKATETALALPKGGQLQTVPGDRGLTLTHPDIIHMMERRVSTLQNLRLAAIKATRPDDWTLFRPKEGEPQGICGKAGCTKIGQLYGVQILNPTPVEIVTDGDKKVAQCFGDGYCALTGQIYPGLRGYRVAGERFTGRDPGEVGSQDLIQAARTALETKAVRILTGLVKVSLSELAAAWGLSLEETQSRCVRGAGYGKSKDREDPPSGGPAPSGSNGHISEAQGKRAYAIAAGRAKELNAEGVDARAILKETARQIGVPEGGKITRDQYDAWVEKIQKFTVGDDIPFPEEEIV